MGRVLPTGSRLSAHSVNPSLLAEVHFRCLPGALVGLEIWLLLKTHEAGDQHGGKPTARGVVLLSSHCIVAARGCQSIFRPGQLVLQLQETLVRFQYRVILSD